jgi:hypothetical protein
MHTVMLNQPNPHSLWACGTQAGTVGSSVYGVAKGVYIVPVRALDNQGSGVSHVQINGLI